MKRDGKARSVGGCGQTAGVERQLPEPCVNLLSRQCGVIANWQAQAAGVSAQQIENLLRYERWRRLRFGVYAAFTGKPGRPAVLWAAVLRCGPAALLSHETAAELDGLLGGPAKLIHVTVPAAQHRPPVAGIAVHRTLRSIGFKQERGLPPRSNTEETVLDLAQAAGSFDDVVALLARACQLRLSTPFLLEDTLRQRAKARWRTEISEALRDGFDGVHSLLEYRYARDVERAHGLPRPDRQAQAAQHGARIFRDIHYRAYRLAIELDGKASHPDEQRWRDTRRDNDAAAAGIATLRYGWADVTEHPCQTARQIATVLASRGWRGTPRRCGPACGI
jgi:very-short-patch-repair endonuclease